MPKPAQSNFVASSVVVSGEGSECLRDHHKGEVVSEDALHLVKCSYFPNSRAEQGINQIFELNLQGRHRRKRCKQ
jgi:hypothetical protein